MSFYCFIGSTTASKKYHPSPAEGPTSKSAPLDGCPKVNTLRNLCREWLLTGCRESLSTILLCFITITPLLCCSRELAVHLKRPFKAEERHFAIFCCCPSNTQPNVNMSFLSFGFCLELRCHLREAWLLH